MQFKLTMPRTGRMADRGVIVKWHRSEGDPVGFGDELFDYEVDEVVKMIRPLTADAVLDTEGRQTPGAMKRMKVDMRVRVTSSDVGVLRHILVREGEGCAAESVVGVLTLEADDPVDPGSSEALARAPEFRIATNILQEGLQG